MSKIRCIIVDDEALARQVIRKYLEDLPDYEIVAECKNAVDAISVLSNNAVDLIFLDINMPKLNGLSFLKTLNNPPMVIITTAYKDYAVEGYELDVLDYLNKPFSFERFLKGLSKVNKYIGTKDNVNKQEIKSDNAIKDFIFIKADKKTYRLNFSEIRYIEALGDYVKICTENDTIVSYSTLKKLEAALPFELFPRVHKSYIVSIAKVDTIEGNTLNIGDKNITIGSSYRKRFFDLIQKHLV